MSKRTMAKLGRTFSAQLRDGRVSVERKEAVDPPAGKEAVTIEYGGISFIEYCSPGQIINKRKAFDREMKRRGLR